MAINVNENGTIKQISDNLRPGLVFLLDLSQQPIGDLGITEAHLGHTSSQSYMYSTSFELGFVPHAVILLCLISGGDSFLSPHSVINEKRDALAYYDDNLALFNDHKIAIYFQGNTQWPITGSNTGYFGMYANATTPRQVTSSSNDKRFILTNFRLNGSKLDMYNYSDRAASYFSLDKYFGFTPSYDGPYFLVIAF